MKPIFRVAVLPLLLIAFGCKGNDSKKTDDALNSDLSLASQANPMTPADSISAIERAHADSVARRSETHRVADHRSYQGNSSRASVAAPAPTTTVRNTKRDAAIGAGAGAILGAVTSKNKVKGGIIGGILGGVAGGVLGNNVDTKKVSHP
jgi:hypothetical protein